MKTDFQKISIVGTGLIGASIGLAIKKAGLVSKVIGTDIDIKALNHATEIGAIDEKEPILSHAIQDSSLIILASPVQTLEEIVTSTVNYASKNTILSDVGSVKGQLVKNIDAIVPPNIHFVGAHPIAGSEKSSALASRADLFMGKHCILTPTQNTSTNALNTVHRFWELIGAKVTTMDPFLHDMIFGAVSHFPHVVSYTMLNTITRIKETLFPAVDPYAYAPSSLKDMTRIASSAPSLWSEICLHNAENMLPMLKKFQDELDTLITLLQQKDKHALQDTFAKAKKTREQLH